MQTWIVFGGPGDSRTIGDTRTRAWPDRYLKELALRHTHANFVLLVNPNGTLQEHGSNWNILHVDGNTVLGIQHDATVYTF